MAIQLEANYSKKLGLPGYSSHQFSVTIKSELTDLTQIEQETARLYALLQTSVDRELQNQGYVPEQNGHKPTQIQTSHPRNGLANGNHPRTPYRNGHQNRFTNSIPIHQQQEHWKCSPKQQELILKIIQDQRLDKRNVEHLSMQLFGIGVKTLNKLQASGLIDELLQLQETQAAAGGRQ